MAKVVPSILTNTPSEFGLMAGRLNFADRVHIDIASPPFTKARTIGLAQLVLPGIAKNDLHLMMHHPDRQIETVISLNPNLAIAHFEADGNLVDFFWRVGEVGIKTGLALLPETPVSKAADLIKDVNHVLIFTGHLGFYGGALKAECLPKIAEAKKINPDLEVSVDGGINPGNAKMVAEAGADILISGGFIVNADDPKAAYETLSGAL